MSMPGATSVSSRPSLRQPEHAAFGHVEHRLSALRGVLAAEGPMLDLPDELLSVAVLAIASRPSSIAGSRPPASKVPTNTTFFAFWLILMKPPAPASCGPNLLTLTIALPHRPAPGRGKPASSPPPS